MSTREQHWAKDVQITLSWERFRKLCDEGKLDLEELSQLKDEGRAAFVDDFEPTASPLHAVARTVRPQVKPLVMRPKPEYLPDHDQAGKSTNVVDVQASCSREKESRKKRMRV